MAEKNQLDIDSILIKVYENTSKEVLSKVTKVKIKLNNNNRN
jgi:hypothetical protein